MISIIVKLLFTNSIVATVDLEKSIDQILACSDILGLDSEGHVPTICYEAAVGLTPNLRRGRRSIHQTPFQVPSMNQMCSSECKRYPRLIRIDFIEKYTNYVLSNELTSNPRQRRIDFIDIGTCAGTCQATFQHRNVHNKLISTPHNCFAITDDDRHLRFISKFQSVEHKILDHIFVKDCKCGRPAMANCGFH